MSSYKDTGVSVPLPAGTFDACVKCGEPVKGLAFVSPLSGMAWHHECSPLADANRAMQAYLEASLAAPPTKESGERSEGAG
jgi:hypothetical protein